MNTQSKLSRRSIMVFVSLALAATTLLATLASCSNTQDPNPTETVDPTDTYVADIDMDIISQKIDSMEVSDYREVTPPENAEISDLEYKYVKISVKGYGDIIVRLLDDVAPGTVSNFRYLVYEKFYDGLTFHRVMSGFMIQGGCPKGDGTGNSGQWIQGEFAENGITNDLSHIRGVISMARGSYDMDSASSQFFIMHADNTESLDGKYAAFGYVVAGMDVVDAIASVSVTTNASGEKSQPTSKIVIDSVRFVEYVAPVTDNTPPAEDSVADSEADITESVTDAEDTVVDTNEESSSN